MIKVKNIYEFIDSFAPFDSAEDWDNVGILVGDKNAEVTKALLALDITNDVVEEAHDKGAQAIISHHPIIFGGIKHVLSDSAVYRAAKYDISCICAHTNLDRSTVFGVNTELAKACGLTNVKFCEESEIMFAGELECSVRADEFAKMIKSNLGMSGLVFTNCGKQIKKAAVSSGAGGSEIFSAVRLGADAFITGEIKHHELVFANEAGISVYVLGHYQSENVVIKPLCEKLAAEFPDTEFVVSETFSDNISFI